MKRLSNQVPFSSILLGGAVIFVIVGLIDPSWGVRSSTDAQQGLDIMVMMDVSKSMQVMDVGTWGQTPTPIPSARDPLSGDKPSRLNLTKDLVGKYVVKNSQHRYGLGVFAGESVGISPLTNDSELFLTFLDGVDHNNLSEQGTDLVGAVEFGMSRFGTKPPEPALPGSTPLTGGDSSVVLHQGDLDNTGRVLLIISDGGEDEIDISSPMVQQASDMGVYVMTIGVGTKAGGPIPEGRDVFGNMSWKLYNGETVISSYNPRGLEQLADRFGGDFVRLEDQSDISKIQKSLEKLDTKAISKDITNKRYIGRWLVGIGLLLFLIYLISLLFAPRYIGKK